MSTKKRSIVVVCLTLGIALFFLWRTGVSPSGNSEGSTAKQPMPVKSAQPAVAPLPNVAKIDEKRRELVDKVEDALKTSIHFYGRVVDERGNGVPAATVAYSLLDQFNASGSNARTIADQTGYFEISGVRGAVLGVNVSKEGYYQIHNISNQSFAYGIGSDASSQKAPQKGVPVIFTLHKMKETEPLIKVSSRQFEIPRNGGFAAIDLSGDGRNELRVGSRIEPSQNGLFSWQYELSVSGGGLAERSGEFDFIAPKDGYVSEVKIGMAASDPAWKRGAEKEFFIKFPSGNYARVQIRFYPRDDRSMIVLEALVNPKEGSRNLEFDPAKVAQ